MNMLDRPVWASLTTAHTGLAIGDGSARRYRPDINLFASAADDGEAAQAALAGLVAAGERVFVLQAAAIRIPPELSAVTTDLGVQMVASGPIAAAADDQALSIRALGEDDAQDMLDLATLTRPGPFLRNTRLMGEFFGIRIDGRLAAMAGERFRFPGYTELSGVCTHPDFRGRGLAGRLSRWVASRIAARGETAFLHAWKRNTPAIALYAKLGFQLRCEVHVAVLARRD